CAPKQMIFSLPSSGGTKRGLAASAAVSGDARNAPKLMPVSARKSLRDQSGRRGSEFFFICGYALGLAKGGNAKPAREQAQFRITNRQKCPNLCCPVSALPLPRPQPGIIPIQFGSHTKVYGERNIQLHFHYR